MPQSLSSRTTVRLREFFRSRLLTFETDAEVIAFLEGHDQEVKAIKDDLLRMCWFMRGGLSYHDSLELTTSERQIIADIIKSNLEVAKESKMPFW
jgi:ABC-type uncharacterized transport system fused permease/ATPase subunit